MNDALRQGGFLDEHIFYNKHSVQTSKPKEGKAVSCWMNEDEEWSD